jgi:Mpv17 / PMP22 family
MWSQYKKLLTRRPLLTKAVTASSLMSLSDLACQSMERAQKGHGNMATNNLIDWQRTLHVGVTGLTFTGPLTHAWYELLGKLPPVSPSTATTSLTGMQWASSGAAATLGNKMLLDALIFSPIAVAGYFVWRSMLEGRGFDGTFEKLQSKWSQALFSSWSFWPAANVM